MGHRLLESFEQLPLKTGSGVWSRGIGLDVIEEFRLDQAKDFFGRQFPDEVEAADAEHEHVVGALGGLLVGGDPAEAGVGSEGRAAVVVVLPSRGERPERDQPVVLDRLFEQRLVTRLEDVKRLHDVRKHDQVRQWKHPGESGELVWREGERLVGHGRCNVEVRRREPREADRDESREAGRGRA